MITDYYILYLLPCLVKSIGEYTKEDFMSLPVLLFDLDGTLVNSKPGILNSVRYALTSLNKPIPEDSILDRFVGPPLTTSFPQYCHLDEKQTWEAIKLFRNYYNEHGIYESSLFPEVADTLSELKCKGYSLYISTSKPDFFAERILKHLKIRDFFDGIVGSKADGTRSNKIEVLQATLEEYSLDKNNTIMIGDTPFDILPSNEIGIQSIAVTYGSGLSNELKEANPTFMISHFHEIIDCISQKEACW